MAWLRGWWAESKGFVWGLGGGDWMPVLQRKSSDGVAVRGVRWPDIAGAVSGWENTLSGGDNEKKSSRIPAKIQSLRELSLRLRMGEFLKPHCHLEVTINKTPLN